VLEVQGVEQGLRNWVAGRALKRRMTCLIRLLGESKGLVKEHSRVQRLPHSKECRVDQRWKRNPADHLVGLFPVCLYGLYTQLELVQRAEAGSQSFPALGNRSLAARSAAVPD